MKNLNMVQWQRDISRLCCYANTMSGTQWAPEWNSLNVTYYPTNFKFQMGITEMTNNKNKEHVQPNFRSGCLWLVIVMPWKVCSCLVPKRGWSPLDPPCNLMMRGLLSSLTHKLHHNPGIPGTSRDFQCQFCSTKPHKHINHHKCCIISRSTKHFPNKTWTHWDLHGAGNDHGIPTLKVWRWACRIWAPKPPWRFAAQMEKLPGLNGGFYSF